VACSAGGDGGRKSPKHSASIRTRLFVAAIAQQFAIYQYAPLNLAQGHERADVVHPLALWPYGHQPGID